MSPTTVEILWQNSDAIVYRSSLSQAIPEEQLLSECMSAKRERLLRLAESDRKRSLIGEWMIKQHMLELGHAAPIFIHKTELGQPYLPEHLDHFISISHSEDLIIAAISSLAIGIDIEYMDPKNLDVISMLHPDEQAWILEQSDLVTAFYTIWTQKEAYVKFTGDGFMKQMPGDWSILALTHLKIHQEVYKYCNKSYMICVMQSDIKGGV